MRVCTGQARPLHDPLAGRPPELRPVRAQPANVDLPRQWQPVWRGGLPEVARRAGGSGAAPALADAHAAADGRRGTRGALDGQAAVSRVERKRGVPAAVQDDAASAVATAHCAQPVECSSHRPQRRAGTAATAAVAAASWVDVQLLLPRSGRGQTNEEKDSGDHGRRRSKTLFQNTRGTK